MTAGDSIDIIIEVGRPIVIGRSPGVDVFVMAPSVGRRVVMLHLEEDGVRVMDLGSGGGSSLEIDGVVTPRPVGPLPDKSILRIGSIPFRVEFLPEP
jgi:hypothetical protein